VSFPRSSRHVLTCWSRTYECTLILRTQAVDPRRSPHMIEEEEKAREYFEETKDILQLFCPCGWIEQFQKHVEDFIQEQLSEAADLMAGSITDEEDTRLHGLRRLVAGAVQEGELVRQPDYAATCAKFDRAIVWEGRGYVLIAYSLFRTSHLRRVNGRKFRQLFGW
jgi:hypothetical protein